MRNKNYYKIIGLVCTLIILLSFGISFAKVNNKYVPGDIVIKFTKNSFGNVMIKKKGNIALTGISSVDKLNQKHKVREIESFIKVREIESIVKDGVRGYEADNDPYGLSRIHKFKLSEEADIESIIKDFKNNPDVEYAELNPYGTLSLIPNDLFYPWQWGPPKIGMPLAWDIHIGSPSQWIAIVDSGIDQTHYDIAGMPGKLYQGWNFVDNNQDTMDYYGHGTAVAGIAAAITDNTYCIAGTAPLSTYIGSI